MLQEGRGISDPIHLVASPSIPGLVPRDPHRRRTRFSLGSAPMGGSLQSGQRHVFTMVCPEALSASSSEICLWHPYNRARLCPSQDINPFPPGFGENELWVSLICFHEETQPWEIGTEFFDLTSSKQKDFQAGELAKLLRALEWQHPHSS